MDPVKQLIDSRPGFADANAAELEEAVKINDFIYMSTGTSNAYMVRTDAGRVIINTGMGFESLTHKKVFDAVDASPTQYILLTQGHVDHVGGVQQFRDAGTKLIAQQNNEACQHDDERIQTVRMSQAYIWFQNTIDKAAQVAETNPEVFVQDKPVVDISFDDCYRFEVGGVQFELIATPGGETVDSCVVWLPQHKILFSGNVFGPLFPHFPNINTIRGDRYRFIEPYLKSLHSVRALEPELLITGHFDPVQGKELIRTCLDRMEGAVDYVHKETLKGMNEGKDVWTLMRDVQLPAELEVGQGYGKVSWAVRTIWESYMGWFKAQDSSELYATQPREVYSELVALAGLDAVIKRGNEKLAANDPEQALLLAEAALAHSSTNATALRLALDAHQALLKRSGGNNFWETGWLNTQIAGINERLQQIS